MASGGSGEWAGLSQSHDIGSPEVANLWVLMVPIGHG